MSGVTAAGLSVDEDEVGLRAARDLGRDLGAVGAPREREDRV